MPMDRVKQEFVTRLKEHGILAYVHTVNSFAQIEEFQTVGEG